MQINDCEAKESDFEKDLKSVVELLNKVGRGKLSELIEGIKKLIVKGKFLWQI